MKLPDLASVDTAPAWCPGCGNFPLLKAFKRRRSRPAGLDADKLVPRFPASGRPPSCRTTRGGSSTSSTDCTAAPCPWRPAQVRQPRTGGGRHQRRRRPVRRGWQPPPPRHAPQRQRQRSLCTNNQVYGLTKGQASPTSDEGFVTRWQTHGVMAPPFNPLAVAIAEGCSFVARSFTGDAAHLQAMMAGGPAAPGRVRPAGHPAAVPVVQPTEHVPLVPGAGQAGAGHARPLQPAAGAGVGLPVGRHNLDRHHFTATTDRPSRAASPCCGAAPWSGCSPKPWPSPAGARSDWRFP